MLIEARRELIKILEKENSFKKINDFLFMKVIEKRPDLKSNVLIKINEVDLANVNELLIKKILEYRQVRNYNKEEENSVKAQVEIINKKVTEYKNKSLRMMRSIIQKQDQLIHCYENLESDSQTVHITSQKIKQLMIEHSRLLISLCSIVDEKHKRSIKLFWRSENRREREDYAKTNTSYITFDNLQHQNKLLREELSTRQKKIQHKKKKLDSIIMTIENRRRLRKQTEALTSTKVIPLLEESKEKCLRVSSGIATNKRLKHKLFSDVAMLRKKVGILKYKM